MNINAINSEVGKGGTPASEGARLRQPAATRRELLSFAASGIGATAAAWLLARQTPLSAAEPVVNSASRSQNAASEPHFAPRAKRVIQICLLGGLSHLDSFDYKPKLAELHGKTATLDEAPDIFFGQVGRLRQSDWEFRPRGESGLWISELFPELAKQADDLAIVRSMATDTANHTPALYVQNSGFQFSGFPSVGSWISYGLGSEADDLPAYVVLPDARGLPNGGSSIWSSGFVPAQHQGVLFTGGANPVRDLRPSQPVSAATEASTREFLRELNRGHSERVGEYDLLAARMRGYELAAKMQLSVPLAGRLEEETRPTLDDYGVGTAETDDFARRCLLARRLAERGVRFVQVFSGGPIGGSPRVSWDAHENVRENHALEAKRIDRPVAALLRDLKARGLLDDTLVLFTTEFGRTPFAQSAADVAGTGRDHNKYGFSVWLAGGGVKRGVAVGATDEIGWKAVEQPTTWHDFHATVLHLLGLDHERLTFYHNGIQRRLTNVHGHVLRELLA